MAGPGGGPPRRSHTKSRKGCETCKKRHIRCDENFPQCRNCTKHKIRCPYNDIPAPDDRSASPDKADLMWTPEIEATIYQWRQTGFFPFPSLQIYPAPSPWDLTNEELRLIHHAASISHELGAIDANGFTLWTRQIPTIIKIGATNRFVLDALLSFSASHIAFLTDCPVVGHKAYEHRGAALRGLNQALGNFSRETGDAILAASLVLSWQATDWKSWTHLMQGTSSVIEALEPWGHESQFGDFIAESASTFPTAPSSPTPDHKPTQPSKEDLDAFQRTLQQLQKVEAHLKQSREESGLKSIAQLMSFLKGARKVNTNLSVAQQFERLRPLRTWLFYLPVEYLRQSNGSASALLIIAHYYTVALLMERLFPEIGAAYFGGMSIGPVEEIARRLLSINISGPESGLQTPLSLMEFPIDTVNEFRSRMGWVQPSRTPSFPQFSPPNFYVSTENSPVSVPATVDGLPYSPYSPYPESPAFSYSTEDLSIVKAEPSPNGAHSPLQLASPFTTNQYLHIPSPSYGGYSPLSSTGNDFGESPSIAYSDNGDFTPYDMGLAASSPMYGGANTFGGVGTSPALSTTPNFPPPERPQLLLSTSRPNPTPSPCLSQHQPTPTLLSPEMAWPYMTSSSSMGHRHSTSTASAPPTPLRRQWQGQSGAAAHHFRQPSA